MKFQFHADALVYLTVDEIWPDGDAPDQPTCADVAKRMEDEGKVGELIDRWNLGSDFDLQVRSGDDAAPVRLR